MITHSRHNSYKIGMTDLFGESSEGFAVSLMPPSLRANFPSDHHDVRY